jgi:hypothetical protein
MKSEGKQQQAGKRKQISASDALEILSAAIAECQRAGVVVERESGDNTVTLRLTGVVMKRDEEGVYLAPFESLQDS